MSAMDPVLAAIVRDYKTKLDEQIAKRAQQADASTSDIFINNDEKVINEEVGDFTNKIVLCKEKDLRYYLRMVVIRLNNEFALLSDESADFGTTTIS